MAATTKAVMCEIGRSQSGIDVAQERVTSVGDREKGPRLHLQWCASAKKKKGGREKRKKERV